MRLHLRSKANPSNPLFSPAEVIGSQPDDAGSHTDLAELAAQFSAHGGGGLSPEHSSDLALEVVLNEIVEQACLATGATGAAIVLWRDKELVCRASSGATAPDLGSRLDPSSGISGQCIRTYRTQSCDDVMYDPRADLEASLRLGIRSVLAMPILRRENLLGVFELFSSRPSAFGERDERTLEALVTRTLINMERAAQPPAVAAAAEPDAVTAEEVQTEIVPPEKKDYEMARSEVNVSGGGPDFLTLMLGAAVLLCAVMLGVLAGRHFGVPGMSQRARSTPAAATTTDTTAAAANIPEGQLTTATSQPSDARTNAEGGAAPGGLLIYENGKEIYRQEPGQPHSAQSSGQPRSGQALSGHARSANPQSATPQSATARSGPGPSIQSSAVHSSAVHGSTAEVVHSPVPAVRAESGSVESLQPGTAPGSVAGSGTAMTAQNIIAAAAANQASGPIMQRAASIQPMSDMELAPAEAEASLLNRVEPEYPDDARQQNIQGEVVLEIHIATDGAVDGVDVVSGPPQLVQPSADAVRQWRFKPYLVNGRPVRVQTRVALSFRLPS